MKLDLDVLPRQLRYWTGHCLLNAFPSVIIACVALEYLKEVQALVAMLWAVIVFIFLFAILTSIRGPLTQSDHTLSRAIRAGVKFRKVVSLISLPLLVPPFTFLIPDLWIGVLATWITLQVEHLFGPSATMISLLDLMDEKPTFLRVFATAMVSGTLISLFMLMISFFAVLVIQRRERAKMYRVWHAHGGAA